MFEELSSVSYQLSYGCRANQASIFSGLLCVLQLHLQGHSNRFFKKFCFPLTGDFFFDSFLLSQFVVHKSRTRLNDSYFFLFFREKLDSMNLLLYMAPLAVAFLLPATLLMEKNVVGFTIELARKDIKLIWYLFFNSSMAYFVNLTNFLVTKHTSALTLQVKKKKKTYFSYLLLGKFFCTYCSIGRSHPLCVRHCI